MAKNRPDDGEIHEPTRLDETGPATNQYECRPCELACQFDASGLLSEADEQ
jgi:hypothetical protein